MSLRLFNVFGKYEQPLRLLPYIVARLTQGEIAELSDGEQVRDFNGGAWKADKPPSTGLDFETILGLEPSTDSFAQPIDVVA